MRTTLMLSTLCLSGLVLTACASTQTTESTPTYDVAPIAANSASLRVNGMSCPKCANNIERQMKTLAGVRRVDIDLGQGLVTVSFDAKGSHPSQAQLAEAIEKTGFTLVSIDDGSEG
jgi:copper chaperone CopZ